VFARPWEGRSGAFGWGGHGTIRAILGALNIDRVNYLNAGLMLLSVLAAFVVPFELFLFAYAVLGPLHYFTQISWLHDRDYFAKPAAPRALWMAFVALAMLAVMYSLLVPQAQRTLPLKWEVASVYVVFATALAASLVPRPAAIAALAAGTLLAIPVLSRSQAYFVFGSFLITIIHVLVFTAAFVLHGSLKNRSRSGFLSLAVFIACAASTLLLGASTAGASAGDSVRSSYRVFESMNFHLIRLLAGHTPSSRSDIYESAAGLSIMRLVAFAYTYHYLNWFSKTSVIKWHDVSRLRAVSIFDLWLISLGVYAYDYGFGMKVLFFFSILHVLLEFPLDHFTFVDIGRRIWTNVSFSRHNVAIRDIRL